MDNFTPLILSDEFSEVTPYNDKTTFDPMYGFPNGRKERGESIW